MPIFPYDEEEERRRRMLTPPINPNAPPVLPNIPAPRPRPMLPPPGDAARLPAPDYNPPDMAPPSRYQRLEAEKQGYMRGTPGRGKSALTGALEGLASGGLIGAAAGGLTGAIAPRRFREQEFNERVRPQIMERFAFEDADRAAARQAEQDALNAEYKRAQIGELGRRGQPQPARLPAQQLRLGKNRTTNKLEYYDAANPQVATGYEPAEFPKEAKEPMQAEMGIDPESGLSAEEQARASYEARGGDKYVLSHLPERTRRILTDGMVTVGSKTRSANQVEREAAQREYERAIERQLNADKDYTRGAIRSKRVGGRKSQAGATGIARPRSEFNSKKFPGLKFD